MFKIQKTKMILTSAILFFGLFGWAKSSMAADFYVAQTAQGSDSGVDCANAHAVTWFNTSGNWANPKTSGKIGPGDTAHLCGTIADQLTVQNSGLSGSPTTILFEQNAKLSAPLFEANFGNHIGGAILVSGKNHIVIDGGTNGIIENTDTGSQGTFAYYRTSGKSTGLLDYNFSGTAGVQVYNSNNIEVRNLNINNLYQALINEQPNITSAVGVHVQKCNDVSIHDNKIDYVADGISATFYNNSNVEISSNTIHRCGRCIVSGIGSDGYTADNLRINNNRIYDTTPWSYNDGIKIFGRPATKDPFINLKIYGNIIGPAISYPSHAATAWILANTGWIIEPEIYNNLLIGDSQDNVANGYITVGGDHATYGNGTLVQNSKIYNNTIVSDYPSADVGIMLTYDSTGHRIFNNIFKFKGSLIAISSADGLAQAAESDYNLFYANGTLTHLGQSDTSFEIHSIINGNPLLDANYKPLTNSPVIDKGKTLDATFNSVDLSGISRPQGSGWDIGVYEYVSGGDTTAPAAPSGLAVN